MYNNMHESPFSLAAITTTKMTLKETISSLCVVMCCHFVCSVGQACWEGGWVANVVQRLWAVENSQSLFSDLKCQFVCLNDNICLVKISLGWIYQTVKRSRSH